jgi:glycosyltransferase involved in cell wall biosynthesis
MKRSKIIAVHLLNDFSGSPLVFRQSIESLKDNYDIQLFTATPSGNGFLSGINNIQTKEIAYRWNPNKLITLFLFIYSQWQLFWKLRESIDKNDIVYINTLLPFGAALAAVSKKCNVVYHVHEVSIKPEIFKRLLVLIAKLTADKILFVSAYVASCFNFKKASCTVIHNALPQLFTKQAQKINQLNTAAPFTVLMLCSLKAYKGIYEFIEVARQLPQIQFKLVLNASDKEVAAFKKSVKITENSTLFSAQQQTIPFYKKAHLVVNFSRPDEWVETFGMTVLEAMYCGRPVIVPPVGGVCELIDDGVQGFLINSRNMDKLVQCISEITSDFNLYKSLSKNALAKASSFTADAFAEKINLIFFDLNKHKKDVEIFSTKRNTMVA